jgi:hypothetical protein
MAALLETVSCAALCLLPLVQAGSGQRGKEPKKEPQKAAAPLPRLQVQTGKLADARKLARERNAGLLIHVLLQVPDMEKENAEYRKKFLDDPVLRAACERVLVLISDNGQHPSKTVEETVDGKPVTRTACSVYPWFETCAQHQLNFNDLALEYRDEDGSMRCPQTILQAPDGSLLAHLNTSGVGNPGEILAGLDELLKKFGPGLLEAEWTEVSRAREDALAAQAAKAWPEALRKWSRVRELTPRSSYGAEAGKALPEVERELGAEIERSTAELVPGRAAAAWKRLSELQRGCAGLPVEKTIAAVLKKAESRKELQDELAAVKLEAEADALLRTAQELADAKKDKELEKTVRKLLGKKYAATPAAERARSLWPEWAEDEARKSGK